MTGDECHTRRRYLKALGATALATPLAGCPDDGERTPTESPQHTPRTPDTPDEPGPTVETEVEEYATVVDVVEAGASPDGDASVTRVLERVADDDTLLYFPPGEYLLADSWRVEEFDGLGILGRDATIRPVDGFDDQLVGLGDDSGARNLSIRNLRFDFTAPDTGGRPLHVRVDDGLYVGDVAVAGRQDVAHDCMRFDVTDADGTGLVERLHLPNGAVPEYDVTGCYVGEGSRGSLTFRDCHVAGFPDNGLYASPSQGEVTVVGGYFENSGVSNVRVSGPATVRGATIRCDEAREGFSNQRGIRLRAGSDVLVADCRVEMVDVTSSDGAITMSSWLESATVRNSRLVVEADGVPGIWAKEPAEDFEDGSIRIENVTLSGAAATGDGLRFSDRAGCLVDDTCIWQPGRERNGVFFRSTRDATLRHSEIAVGGDPVVVEGSRPNLEDVGTERLSPGTDEAPRCG